MNINSIEIPYPLTTFLKTIPEAIIKKYLSRKMNKSCIAFLDLI